LEEKAMKTYFNEPSVEVIKFAVEDVITVSGDDLADNFMPPCI
jgi:hypothetical protein